MAPRRIQLRRAKGWRKPAGAVVVARPSKWGNPFRVGDFIGSPAEARGYAVDAYQQWLDGMRDPFDSGQKPPTCEAIRRELRGRDLACWCPLDQPCHADVLLRLANEETGLSAQGGVEPRERR